MAQYKAFGRTITIDDETSKLLEEYTACMSDITCERYLEIEFDFDQTEEKIKNISDDDLSQIVIKRAKIDVMD